MIFYKNNMTSISYSPMDDSIIFYVKYVLSKQQVKFLNPFVRKYPNWHLRSELLQKRTYDVAHVWIKFMHGFVD